MLILGVDTSAKTGSLALARGEKVEMEAAFESAEGFSSRLFRETETLARKAGISMKDIDLYAVNAGPGSFTGLRVGLTAVKAWAEVFGKPIAAVSGLAAVAMQSNICGGATQMRELPEESGGEPADGRKGEERRVTSVIVPVIDARRGQIYGGVYQRTSGGLEKCGEECVMAAEEFLRELRGNAGNRGAIFVTPNPEVLREALASSDFRESPLDVVSPALAAWIAKLGFGQAQRGETVDAFGLEASYIRRSDAEIGAGQKEARR